MLDDEHCKAVGKAFDRVENDVALGARHPGCGLIEQEHFVARIYPTAWQLELGLLLVLVALFARNGILGLGEALYRRYQARRSAS